MKKYVKNIWCRALAVFLCSVSVVMGVASGAALLGVYGFESKEEMYASGANQIAENYAAYLYDNLEDLSKIEKFLEDKNFTCSITHVMYQVDGEEVVTQENVLFDNLKNKEEFDYGKDFELGVVVDYNVDSALNAVRKNTLLDEGRYLTSTPISGYVFDAEAGLFYYYAQAIDTYFPIDYVNVSDGSGYYDYQLTKVGSEKVYYNSYYDRILDTSGYNAWKWVSINDEKRYLSQEENEAGKVLKVVTDNSEIEKHIYTGSEYYVDSFNSEISYIPMEERDFYRILIQLDHFADAEIVHGTMDGASKDMFSEWKIICDTFYENIYSYTAVLISSIVLFLFCLVWIIYSAKGENEPLGFWHKIPVGIFTVLIALLETPFVVLCTDAIEPGFAGYRIIPIELWLPLCGITIFAMALLVIIWIQTIITRCKSKTIFRYSELYYLYQLVKWLWTKLTTPVITFAQMVSENTKLFTKGLVIILVISFIEFMAMICLRWDFAILMLLFLVEKIVMILVISVVLLQMQKLQEGSKRIAAGDLAEPIDTSKMVWEFKKHGENINKVSDGIALAVEDRMKSERFKTELITNVSHDIKTPLTSIINYVDLMKKEDIQDETLQDYVEVLDRQSARLKKLIEDLMEASKASTGNMAVNLEACDVDVFLTQLIGEFEEKLLANQLEVVVQKPEKPVLVSVDGRHMWRVLDNLLSNVCKYSLPGTRVYVSLEQKGNEATITFKNISKTALNIPSEELMERFVRGDSSRNTEGSGLGLSIAQSLTELMKGTMKLEIDGDLFKVILTFQAI